MFSLEQTQSGLPIRGEAAGDHAGACVSGAGDLDGDGLAGPRHRRPRSTKPRACSPAAATSSTAAPIPLQRCSSTQPSTTAASPSAPKISSTSPAARSLTLGDVDGDGLADVILGAYGVDASGTFSGRSYVIYGASAGGGVGLEKIVGGVGGRAYDGEAEMDFSGQGDLRRRRRRRRRPRRRDHRRSRQRRCGATGPAALTWSLEQELKDRRSSSPRSSAARRLRPRRRGRGRSSRPPPSRSSATSTATACRPRRRRPLRRPQRHELRPRVRRPRQGERRRRRSGAVLAGDGGFAIDGQVFRDYAGAAIAGAGDVDGDGLDDIVIGACGNDVGGGLSGRAYVVFGKADTAQVFLGNVAQGEGGFALNGEASEDRRDRCRGRGRRRRRRPRRHHRRRLRP
ncbi:MAG: FG-GAP repeat protein [Nannocystis sp.]|nr:FG-GAP repeat protein [Nannocystis sp.]